MCGRSAIALINTVRHNPDLQTGLSFEGFFCPEISIRVCIHHLRELFPEGEGSCSVQGGCSSALAHKMMKKELY